MCERSPNLSARIAAEIIEYGPMRFSRFMELALYDLEDGYYASGRAVVGRAGDFFTNASIGAVYGEILAGQFLEIWKILGKPSVFTIVEQGANDGTLTRDIIDSLTDTPLANARHIIVEPFPELQKKQSALLADKDVSWVRSPSALPVFSGVHFSNELFDALPINLVRSCSGRWHEVLVKHSESGFFFDTADQPMATSLPERADGFTTELRCGQSELLSALQEKMSAGFVLAVDYGMDRDQFLAPHRSQGTLACYYKHHRDVKPLEFPGLKDITSHVDFSSLVHDATDVGLELRGFTDQHHFVVGAATQLLHSLHSTRLDAATSKKLRNLRMLFHPETMGTQFKAILFSKNIPDDSLPSGFQYARDCAYLLARNVSERL